ncbi:holin [Ornithinibacillus caprae]|uniref:holin n=1 Tax=Ornithinibacillus caprae TaxID=2678566 RepID=UPI0012D875A0
MVEILAIASVIAPVTSGVVQAVKSATGVNKRYLPVMAMAVGIGLGAAAFFVDIGLGERVWAGGISGLASVGLFELSKKSKGDEK